MELLAVVTTTDSKEAASAFAQALVEKRLAACVQISAIESFYDWQGAVQQDLEYRVVAKTTAERYQEVEKTIRDMHSYELPAIYGVPLSAVYGPYADWVKDNSQGAHEF